MKNKLLLSTAIASVAFAGLASAETKVTGNLEQTLNATSEASAQDSKRALGAEYNIGLSGSKDLDNGMSAKYGFTLEDGVSDTHYLTVGGDTVSLSIARDTGNNLSSTAVPHLGDQAGTLLGTLGSATSTTYDNVDGANNAHEADHISIDMKAAGGTFTVRYAPDSTTRGTDTSPAESGNSSTEILYSGSPIEGAKVIVGQITTDGEGAAEDAKFKKFGASYNFGSFTVGAEKQKSEDAAVAASQVETDVDSLGVSYAVNDQVSIGLRNLQTEKKTGSSTSANDEEITTFEVGYNFGGLGIVASYSEVDHVGNAASADAEVLQIRTVQKF